MLVMLDLHYKQSTVRGIKLRTEGRDKEQRKGTRKKKRSGVQ